MIAWNSGTSSNEMRIILIASQDAELVAIWETLFQQKSCHVISEASAKDALQSARLLSPALIVLDLNLPNRERLALCKELRSTTNGTLLLLAPKQSEMELSNFQYAGVDEFIFTPISPMALLIKSMVWLVRRESITPHSQPARVYVS